MCVNFGSFFQAAGLQFRGQKIWLAAIEELLSQGMQNAEQVSHFSLCCCSILIFVDCSNQYMYIRPFSLDALRVV